MKFIEDQLWQIVLKKEFDELYFSELVDFVEQEYESGECYPAKEKIFRAFELCAFENVKVVILGQDPYHGFGQADGLSFSVPGEVKIPPSLRNIFKEIKSDLGIEPQNLGNLERWAKQGVLLMNATLTVRKDTAGSHQKRGWERFTDSVIRELSEKKEGVVFMLWGNYAQKKGEIIDSRKHLILKSAHPSPLSAYQGFWANKHFSTANDYLLKAHKVGIDWS